MNAKQVHPDARQHQSCFYVNQYYLQYVYNSIQLFNA